MSELPGPYSDSSTSPNTISAPPKVKSLSRISAVAILALTVSNFAYQALFAASHNWDKAADRSFFQGLAILAVYVLYRVNYSRALGNTRAKVTPSIKELPT